MGAYLTIRRLALSGFRVIEEKITLRRSTALCLCIVFIYGVRNTSAPRRRREQHEHRRWGLEHGTIRHRYCVQCSDRLIACRIAPTPPAPPSPSPKPRYTAHGPARGCAGFVTLGWGVVFTIETRHAAEVVGCVAELP